MATDIDLGNIQGLEPESVGVPGQRTFRIHAQSNVGFARLWLEKEQLRALTVAIEQLLGELPTSSKAEEDISGGFFFPGSPDYEFQLGRLTLAYEQDRDLITLRVRELLESPVSDEEDIEDIEGDDEDDEDGEGISLRFSASRAQMRRLSRRALEVVASGRPLCPLCHQPLDGPTHFCVRRNGHAHTGEE